MSNEVLPSSKEILKYCQKQLPKFQWNIVMEAVNRIYLSGSFGGKVLHLRIGLRINFRGAKAYLDTEKCPLVCSADQVCIAQSSDKNGITYQEALTEIANKLNAFIKDTSELQLDTEQKT